MVMREKKPGEVGKSKIKLIEKNFTSPIDISYNNFIKSLNQLGLLSAGSPP